MIHQGVSFYSYQNAYRAGQLDMDGMVHAVKDLGCDGVELVPIMTPPTSYPKATEAEIAAWHELMAKYGTKPTCFDSIIAVKPEMSGLPFAHPGASIEEQTALMRDELTLCHQLGFYLMRIPVGYGIQMQVIEDLLPMAEELNITLGLEIHVPMTITGEMVQNYINFIVKKKTKHACLIPDMAIFATSLPRCLQHKALSAGADPEVVKTIVQAYEARSDMTAVAEELRAKGVGEAEELLAFAVRNVPSRVDDLPGILPYIGHFHGKFYDMDDQCCEHGIRFDEVVPILKKAGWEGYINSEYEGQRFHAPDDPVDELEQVRRQHQMVTRLLAD